MISMAVDFDGTLVYDDFPRIGKPRTEVINLVKRLQQSGARTILWTCRKGACLEEAVLWCKQQGLNFVCVNENLPEVQEKWGGDTRKVMVDYYLDDKNVSCNSLGFLEGLTQQVETINKIKRG